MKSNNSKTSKFNEYLKSHTTKKDQTYTHTRIGDKDSNIYGGSYYIDPKKLEEFWSKYYSHVFEKGNAEYLTEKQLENGGPILIDIDLRYDTNIDTRQHTKDHIIDAIMLYADELEKIYNIIPDKEIPVFVFEKKEVNKLDTKTKDGIHIIFGIKSNKIVQSMLRSRIIQELKAIWDDLPVQNTWDEIIDEGIAKGHVNWQLYGSKKPNHKPYMLKYHFNIAYVEAEKSWDCIESDVSKFNYKNNFKLLSAQYPDHIEFDIKDSIKEEYEKWQSSLVAKKRAKKYKLKIKSDKMSPYEINSKEKLDVEIEKMFDDLRPIDYELKETHNFVMILPKTYWGPGSYDKWIRVGWALKNTSERLLLTWIKLSSQSDEFDFNDVESLCEMWAMFNNEDPLTKRSIMYWAKNDAPMDYKHVRRETIDYFVEETLVNATEFDFATVLYNIFKDTYVCVSIKNNIWYEYINHRWFEIDSGNSLRLKISKDMHEIYIDKTRDAINKLHNMDQSDEERQTLEKRANKITDTSVLLKKTQWKNNIMKEARELFYNKDFINNIDQNPYLLCFNNGVIDFKNKIHRKGLPEDNITKCTNIDYVKLDKSKHQLLINEVNEFMDQLFPTKELRKYMWNHLSSCLIGTNENQTFNIYTGSGANGKSKLVDLMTKLLGDYKGTVPITLVTQKRNGIGNTSSEVVQLQGTRYAVMQEPSKGEKINEGIMKEITGGDPLQARALFKESVTFIPQFKLVVCTNHLFDIKSNDDGTWRRIRVCPFQSKFTDKPFENEDKFPREHYPHQFKIDKKLEDKFPQWIPIFMAMLVELAYKNRGNVEDCNMVMASSEQYREGQDYLAEFVKEHIKREDDYCIKKTELRETFKQWYISNYDRNVPKVSEINDYMNKRFGCCKPGKGWSNVKIIYEEDEEEEIDNF
jgi:P4 family phage/plasmid primase-like protien